MTNSNDTTTIGPSHRRGDPADVLSVPWWASGLLTWSDDVGAEEGIDADIYRLLDDDAMGLELLERIAG